MEEGNEKVLSMLTSGIAPANEEEVKYFRAIIEILSLPQDALKRLNHALLLNEMENAVQKGS